MSAAATGDAAMTALAPERPPVGLLLLAGILALAIGVGGFGGWAAYAPFSSAAVDRGVISVAGNRKVVQHPEGGSIDELRVRDSDRGRPGQLLLRRDNLTTHAIPSVVAGQAGALAIPGGREQ